MRILIFDSINEKIKSQSKVLQLKTWGILTALSLLTVYKSFVYYGDVMYDQLSNNGLSEKIESIQYNAALAITDPITGTSNRFRN